MSGPSSSSSEASRQNEGSEERFDDPASEQKKSDQCPELPVMETERPASGVGIDKLPDEVMVRILSLMTSDELINVTQNVCSNWRRLSQDPAVWHDKKFYIRSNCSDDHAVAMLRQMPQLCAVVVQRVVEPSVIDALGDSCSSLATLKLDANQQISFPLLKKLVENCQNIRSLTIPQEFIGSECNAETVAQLRQLQSLTVAAHGTMDSFIHLRPFAGCTELDGLHLSPEAKVSAEEIEYFLSEKRNTLINISLPCVTDDGRHVVPLLRQCTALRYLKIDNDVQSIIYDPQQEFSGLCLLSSVRTLVLNHFQAHCNMMVLRPIMMGGLSNIRVLDLSHCSLHDFVVVAVCRTCPELRELRLKFCDQLTDKGLTELFRLNKLEVLDLSWCDNLGGEAIRLVAQVKQLRKLSLDWQSSGRLQPGLDSILHISSLESLSVCSMPDSKYFPFDRLAGNLVKLRVLDVSGTYVPGLGVLKEQMPRLKIVSSNIYTVMN